MKMHEDLAYQTVLPLERAEVGGVLYVPACNPPTPLEYELMSPNEV